MLLQKVILTTVLFFSVSALADSQENCTNVNMTVQQLDHSIEIELASFGDNNQDMCLEYCHMKYLECVRRTGRSAECAALSGLCNAKCR